jgi:hypothetical protein
LYFEEFDKIHQPSFSGYLDKDDLKDYLSEELYGDVMRQITEDAIIFLDGDFGIVLFNWSAGDKSINLEEYIIPFRKVKMLSYLDLPTEYTEKCSGL